MDIRNILYKSIEQKVSSGTNFKLFSVDNTNAYTIRVYIDSSGNKFSFEVNNDSNGANYKIENYAINQNITIYKNNQSNSDIYYVKFTNNTDFTIRKEIVYGYLTDANTTNVAVAGSPIITLTTSSPKHIFAGNSAFIGNSTVTGNVDFDGGFTAEKDINLTGNINFNNFYIDDFINTPGTVPDSASKITFKDSDETLDIYGIYNEILQPIKVDDSVYQGKITILVSISNATLSESTQGAAELILLELVGTSQPEQKYQVVYIQSSSSIEIRSIKSNNKEVLSTIMIGGNYIINTVTIPFANNISCKVTNVYLKEEGSAITIYKVADKIIGGGESDSDASHYLLTAQSLSQILTLSSLSAGATTTNLTKNPDSTFNYDSGKNYLLYQTGSNTTNLYLTTDDSNERYIYSQKRQVKNRIGTTASTANTIVIRDDNNNINTGSLTASSVNAEGLNNAGKITVSGNTSTGTLTSGATTVSGTSNLASFQSGATTVTGTANLDSLIANGNVTVNGTTTLGDNASDAINFNSGTTIKGTSTLASLIANGNVTINGAATLGDAASDNINFNATTTIKGTATLGDNASDQINFNAATTVKGTANFKSTLDANGGAVVTGKATLSSLTANGGVDVNGTTNLGDNASDQINFNAATTVKGTANFKSTLDANGGAVVTGKATLSSLTANGGVDVNGTTNLGDNASDAINFNSGTTINGTSTLASLIAQNTVTVKGNTFITGTINFGQVDQTDAASIFAENSSTVSGLIFSIADDDNDYISFRTKHWQNGSKDVLKLNFGSINAASNILPTSNNAISLGNSILRWSGIYATSLNVSGSSILGTSQSDTITLNGILHFKGTTTNDYIRLYTEDIGGKGHKLVHHIHDSDSNAYYKFNFANRTNDTSYDITFPNDNGTIALTKNMDISATRDGAANDISVDQFGTITITINGKSVTISQNSADGSLDISANV